MPDRDIVHLGLNAIWQKPYKEICEGFFAPDICAQDTIPPLIRTVKRYGNDPIMLIKQCALRFDEILAQPLLQTVVDWSAESLKIERLARNLHGNKRGISLALKACKEQLYQVRHAASSPKCLIELVRRYFQLVYAAEFESRVASHKHYHDADPKFVEQRLSEMRACLIESIEALANRVARLGDVDQLRAPARRNADSPIDVETDLQLKTT